MQRNLLGIIVFGLLISILSTLNSAPVVPSCFAATSQNNEYSFWKNVGKIAGDTALQNLNIKKCQKGDCIALSNAGYAQIDARFTQAALDGLTNVLKVSRGDFSLMEIHSNSATPLWFAVYHKTSGICIYLEVNYDAVTGIYKSNQISTSHLFSTATKTVITAEKLFENPTESAAVFDANIFNGNEFRIVTAVNGILAGAPSDVLRSIELHDHYCPGVTSGVFLARYLEEEFPLASGGSYFVQSVQPWCKEDALLAILNTTPGKKGYDVLYPTDEDMAGWKDEVKDAANIIYRKDPDTGTWDGIVVGVSLGETDCPTYDHTLLDKLCSDLYHLENIDKPENYITLLQTFSLPSDADPKDYARPGVDPMQLLGFTSD
ncbi:MAG: FmdE family protein [Desulfobacteraceae bacterium]|jgi:formylmethanofuran dehydrogenase subunit E-like metal-binding protein